MNVYVLRADPDHYKCIIMPEGDFSAFVRRFNGRPIKQKKIQERISVDPGSYSFPTGDFPSLIPGLPVFSKRAVAALRDILIGNGDLLSSIIESEEHYVYNVTRVIDSLDEPNSEVIRFKNSSKVMYIGTHVFFRDKLVGVSIFKIPQDLSDVYVTDAFVERVHSAELKGFRFPLVWSSE